MQISFGQTYQITCKNSDKLKSMYGELKNNADFVHLDEKKHSLYYTPRDEYSKMQNMAFNIASAIHPRKAQTDTLNSALRTITQDAIMMQLISEANQNAAVIDLSKLV